MEVEAVAGVLHEAMLGSNVWFILCREVGGDVVEAGHEEGEEATGPPAQHEVDQEPEDPGVTAWHLGLLQHPANIETHDRHPGEHGHRGEISEISQTDAEIIGEDVLFVVDDEEEHAEKEGGQDVTEDDLPLEIVEVRDKDVDEGGETEEDNTEAAADGVHQPEDSAVFLQTILAAPRARVILDMFLVVEEVVVVMIILVTLHHHFHDLPVAGDSIIDTKVVFKSRLRVVE